MAKAGKGPPPGAQKPGKGAKEVTKPRAKGPDAQQKGKGAPNRPPKGAQPKANSAAGRDEDLLREIKELGGTDEDYDFLVGVDEGDEEEEAVVVPQDRADKNLADQLRSFMKTLGITPGKPMPLDDDEEGEEEEEQPNPAANGKAGADSESGESEASEDEAGEESASGEGESSQDDGDEEDEEGEEQLDTAESKKLGQLKKALSTALKDEKPSGPKLTVPAIPLWHTIPLDPIEPLDEKKNPMGASEKQKRTAALLTKAKKLWEEDSKRYSAKSRMSASDRDFINHVLRSGTTADRVSALQLLVQESPVHSFARLEQDLTAMCSKKARREAMQAVDVVRELLVSGLLPDRKLRYFVDRPLFSPGVTDAHLILWAFEDALKTWYFSFLRTLEGLAHDPLLHLKRKAMYHLLELLASKPEQEQNLLLLLVDKFGDADKQVPSLVSHLLLQLLRRHPAMKLVVIAEVERFLLRPASSPRAKYHAVTFLDQIVLSHREPDVKAANRLVELYFALFEAMLRKPDEKADEDGKPAPTAKAQPTKKKMRHRDRGKKPQDGKGGAGAVVDMKEFEAKMVAAVLTGVNRAWPYSKLEDQIFEKHMDTLFTISHLAAFNTAVQALTFVCQVASARQSASDRLGRAVYELMLHPHLFQASQQAPFLNLIYRVVKADPSVPRTLAMLKRLLQIAANQAPPFAVAALFLLSEVSKEKPAIWASIKMSESREDDDEERFVDVKDDSDDDPEGSPASPGEDKPRAAHPERKAEDARYDPFKREPLHCHADRTCFWELNALADHFHPTVRLYARMLLSLEPIQTPENIASYDPLRNHSLMHFLDRFVFKNPRKASEDTPEKVSVMKPKIEPAANEKDIGVLFHGGKKRMVAGERGPRGDDLPVNDDAWLKRAVKHGVNEDEKFFLTFFQTKAKEQPKRAKKAKASEDADDFAAGDEDLDEDQEMDEDEIWEAMRRSSGFPKVEEDDESDGDDDDLGSDSEDAQSDGEEAVSDAGADSNEVDEVDVASESASEGESEAGTDEMEDALEELPSEEHLDLGQQQEPEADGDVSDAEDLPDFAGSGSDEEDDKLASKPNFLARKAQSLGYAGDFFSRKRGVSDGEEVPRGFASADDFAKLLSIDDGEDFGFNDAGSDAAEDDGQGKRKKRRKEKRAAA
ncbi:CBF/Mak21 family-domain-containing protein [Hyaloraphidium curvatum]|nr:CBF/Mak21 family-domain-containing protein [Hyaloraphidium curvatum]